LALTDGRVDSMSDRVGARVEHVAGAGMDGGKVRALGVLAAAAAVALGVYGAYGDPTAPDNQKSAVPFVAAMAVAVAAVVFGLLVPRGLASLRRGGSGARRWALGHSIVALILIPVFWSGIPLVVGSAGLTLGLAGRRAAAEHGESAKACTSAAVIGLVVALGCVVITVVTNNGWL
jgi:hypothetical protein